MKDKLSVCIVVYRNYDETLQAIDTLNEFTPKEIKKTIYIVDNSEEYSSRHNLFETDVKKRNDVIYINTNENIGFGKGHNRVLEILNSEYHCIMNPDIEFCEDAFSKIISYMDSNPGAGMIIPNIVNDQGVRQLVYREDPTVIDMFIRMFCKELFPKRVSKHTLQYKDYRSVFQVPFGQGSFLVIRTEIFIQLKGFDDRFFMYLEDADLCRRVNQISKLLYFPEATVIHKWEQGSHKNWKLFKVHISSMRKYFRKWGLKWI